MAATVWLAVFFLGIPALAQEYDCAQNRHDLTVIAERAATVDEDGYIAYTCVLCGLNYTVNTYATGHIWGEWMVEKASSCTEEGLRTRTCTKGIVHHESGVIPATGHAYSQTVTPPDCVHAGVATYVCRACGSSYSEPFGQPGEHHYLETLTRPATCAGNGLKAYSCAGCGGEYTETVPALAHIYGEWVTESPAGVGTPGSRAQACIGCGHRVAEEIPALAPAFHFGAAEAAVTGANIAGIYLLYLLLFGEFFILRWKRRKTRQALAAEAEKESDGYEHL